MLRAVAFDLDGTLVDDVSIHVDAWEEAFRSYGLPVRREEIHAQIGKGSKDLIEALVDHPSPELSEGIRHRHDEVFQGRLTEIEPLPKAAELLAAFRARGLRIALVTSSQAAWMIALLGKVGLSFDVMITAADVERTKPDPEPFRKVLERLQLSPGEVLAVGDAPYDAQSATTASIPCVGVLTGGFSEEELIQAGAWMVVKDIGELLQGIDSLLASLDARMAA